MQRIARGSLVGGICLLCLHSLGCVQVPFYSPNYSVVPAVKPGGEKGEVHVFRVDLTDQMELKDGPPPKCEVSGINREYLELSRVSLTANGTVPRQTGLSWDHGWSYVGFWNFVNAYTSHSVAIRIYRPGYETIELKAGQEPHALEWIEARDLAAQEKAVDDLLGVSMLEKTQAKSSLQQRRLVSGLKSPSHREALLFASREYERLARVVSTSDAGDPDLYARLREKAQSTRSLADGK